MKKNGIKNYEKFAKEILNEIVDLPISFEVFSDDFIEMEKQALEIASWGENVYVKIPITNTKKQSCSELVNKLSLAGVRVNVTAMFTIDQITQVLPGLVKGPGGYISIFAGRVADAGIDPLPIMVEAIEMISDKLPINRTLWKSDAQIGGPNIGVFLRGSMAYGVLVVIKEPKNHNFWL